MKKTLKRIIIITPISIILLASAVIISSYFEHQELVRQEKEKYPPPGDVVEVSEGANLHVKALGEGDATLVFLAGLGTSSPVYDFKVLYSKLSDDYRTVVVERAGYGWSDISSCSRDTSTVLEQTRQALKLAGENPPYILLPHSLAGLESLYWANTYPKEVKAIIGLDPLTPEYYQQEGEKPSLPTAINFLMRTGLVRRQPEVFNENFMAMKKGRLTAEDAEVARTIFYRRVLTENMYNEADYIPANVQTALEQGVPNVPFYAFISNENEKESWSESIINLSEETGGDYFILDAGHYVHLEKPEVVVEKSREVIEGLLVNFSL